MLDNPEDEEDPESEEATMFAASSSTDIEVKDTEAGDELPIQEDTFGGESLIYPSIFDEESGELIREVSSKALESPQESGGFPGEYPYQLYYTGEHEEYKEESVETKEPEVAEESEVSSTSTLSNIYSKLSPFFIDWSFGIKTATKLINLTKENQFEVFYTSSHFGVIYDYQRNTMRFLPGHNSTITSISADASGRWLVTADAGEDNVIIIWDHNSEVPTWSLFNIFGSDGVRCVQISPDAKYLVAISNGQIQSCKFYLWTYGRDHSDGEFHLDPLNGTAVNLQFNHLQQKQFAVTMESKVIFCEFYGDKKPIDQYPAGLRTKKNKIGIFRQTIYLDDTHTAVTSTNLGYVVVWSDIIHLEDETETNTVAINKKFLKAIRIHKSGITSIQILDQIVISSSEEGFISFHDQSLSLIYWMPRYMFEPVMSVSCNLTPQKENQMDPFTEGFEAPQSNIPNDVHKMVEDESWESNFGSDSAEEDEHKQEKSVEFVEGTKAEEDRKVPSDCTIEMRPFYVRDFIFLTDAGKFGYFSHFKTKVRYYMINCEAPALAMDCSPYKPHLALGNAHGRIDVLDYKMKTLLYSKVIANVPITNLKYTPSGRFLMAGLKNGIILIIDPILVNVLTKIQTGKSDILKICFSMNENYLAYYDKDDTVYVYRKNKDQKWVFMGAYKSHYKTIRDLMFDEMQDIDDHEKTPRLYSIGEDRMLVEYDMVNLSPGKLNLKSIDRIEQCAIPQCFTALPKFTDKRHFLIANNEYKLKMLERNTRLTTKTTVGPTADTPLNFMTVVPDWDERKKTGILIYTTEKHIGLRLLPATGNPYEGIGMVGHPVRISSIAISNDYKYVFTTGVDDCCTLMWKVNYQSVEIAHQLGGQGLDPFMCLVEGGPKGFLFREIEDFFYYSQIIHQGEHANVDRSVSKNLALCEIPDLVRALGFYPTESEIADMIHEAKYLDYEETGKLNEEISFDECVKMYLNHRPVNGISMEAINKALLTVADFSDPECIMIERSELYTALERRAEAMSHAEVVGYLCILLLPKDEQDPIPAVMPLKDFAGEVLGVDLTITEENVREITHPNELKKT